MEKIKDETRASCDVKRKKVLKKRCEYVEKVQAPARKILHGQSLENLSNKMNNDSIGLTSKE